jgi:hypothetical protein
MMIHRTGTNIPVANRTNCNSVQFWRGPSSHRFADWIRFADGMSVKLRCDRETLDAWWSAVSTRNAGTIRQDHQTICEAFK